MKLIAFHKILIACAILFLCSYGVYELYDYLIPPDHRTPPPVTAVADPEAVGSDRGSQPGDDTSSPGIDLFIASAGKSTTASLWTAAAMIAGGLILIPYLVRLIRKYPSAIGEW